MAGKKTKGGRRIRKKESAYLVRAFRSMPEVSHKCTIRDDGTVDLSESELIKWAIQNEDILNYIGHRGMSSPYTVFDPKTGKWKGIDSHLTTEQARMLTDTEIMDSQIGESKQRKDKMQTLEESFDEVAKPSHSGRMCAELKDVAAKAKVSTKTIRRWVDRNTNFNIIKSVIYEK